MALTIKANIENLRSELTDPAVTLIAVSKQQSDDSLQSALDAGLRHFGENRVQEAQNHWGSKRHLYPDLTLHCIGPLQSNKVADAVALFDVIHTVDREKIARALSQEMQKQNRVLPCFIQVNTGHEAQKSGIEPDALSSFLNFCATETQLDIIGLMGIPPVDQDPEPHFRLLKQLADQHGLKHLSMGMSDDYQTAIACGATHIRIGSALFGARD